MKNQILLENYYLPGQLEQRLAEFVDYYNQCTRLSWLAGLNRHRVVHDPRSAARRRTGPRPTTRLPPPALERAIRASSGSIATG
jgi:hypothetical protein